MDGRAGVHEDARVTPSDTRSARRRPVVRLVLALVLLLPPVFVLWSSAQEALAHPSSDWMVNHRTRQSFERAALTVAGLPLAGAACGWIRARLKGRSSRLPAATGLLTGVLALWGLGIVGFYLALSRMHIPW